MPVFNHFDLLAPFYDHFIRFLSPEKLISKAELPVQGRLLDAGGGTGRVSSVIREHASQIIIADESFGMLRQAEKKGSLQPVCGSTETLPFPDGTFERIIMVDALHHVYNPINTASELWRVLQPGGRLIIEEPDIQKMSVKLIALVEKITLMRSHFLTPAQIKSLFLYPDASLRIDYESYNAWIIVDKRKSTSNSQAISSPRSGLPGATDV
jgi:ubiquinone/menaquinone biosynthesis C-methylase UbiE